MKYHLLMLIIGIPAAVAAIRAAIDMARNEIYAVGLSRVGDLPVKFGNETQVREFIYENKSESEIFETVNNYPESEIISEENVDDEIADLLELEFRVLDTTPYLVYDVNELKFEHKITVRCDSCRLVQYWTPASVCRRCNYPLTSLQLPKVGGISVAGINGEELNPEYRVSPIERRLIDMEKRIRELEKKSSREWEQAFDDRVTSTSNRIVN
ncbi:MAG: hypothetical protein A3F68_09650 [Acidobacteria bacterium RIFCSPLOWO2_12_FULL_54_10]|nr:MAG: hypothetical protein A3F68_09650 [Acidobacteria bacterium RIFCSPLOWO2_12_FULL_54_10]